MDFLGDDFRNYFCIQHSLVRQWIQFWRQSVQLVLLVTMHLALCSLSWFAGPFLDPMVQTVQNPVEFTQVVFMPVVGQRLALMVQTVPKSVEFPQVQFWDEVVFVPVVGQRLALMVQTVPKPVEFPQVQSSPLLWRRGKSPWSR